MKSKVALIVAICLAFLAAIGIKVYLSRQKQDAAKAVKTVPVLFAAKEIKKGTAVSTEMVMIKDVPQTGVQDGRTLVREDLSQVLRKRVMVDVHEGEQLLWSDFIGQPGVEDVQSDLGPGYRRVTIPVDKVTGCAGLLLPGSVVDIYVALRVRTNPNGPIEPVTQLVMTGMKVVATDLNVRVPSAFLSERDRRDFAAYSTVTLRALPLQANLLVFLAEQGKIHLVTRSPDDPTMQDPSKVDKVNFDNLDTIIKKAAEEKPPALPSVRQP